MTTLFRCTSSGAELRGDIGVGLFMSDPRVVAILDRLCAERPSLEYTDATLLVLWNEKALRDEAYERAERVASQVRSHRLGVGRCNGWSLVDGDACEACRPKAAPVKATVTCERQDVKDTDGVTWRASTWSDGTSTRTRVTPLASWSSTLGGHGSVAKATGVEARLDTLTGESLDLHGAALGVSRWANDGGMRETDVHYRCRLLACVAEKLT